MWEGVKIQLSKRRRDGELPFFFLYRGSLNLSTSGVDKGKAVYLAYVRLRVQPNNQEEEEQELGQLDSLAIRLSSGQKSKCVCLSIGDL